MKYFTRLRVKRIYEWRGDPLGFNRKLKTLEYGSLAIRVEGLPQTTIIKMGQHILIEGDDNDNPYVARVVRLFADESGEQMKAVVQWFVRVSEVPPSKLKLLGRDPHPQEIFFYEGRNCDDEVDAKSILRPVQVKHLDTAAPFPDSEDKETLYVKLSWDTRTFRDVDSSLVESAPPRPPNPSLPPSPPLSPPAATPASRGPGRRALPAPDPAVLRRAASGGVRYSRASASAGKATAEAESLHSVTKLSASKCLSAKRRNATERTPGVRKKLRLCSLDEPAVFREDVLNQMLEEELDSAGMQAQRLASSPPRSPILTHSLTPLKRTNRNLSSEHSIHLKPSTISCHEQSLSEADSPPSPAGDDSS
ncbi:hypothetical protein CHARACLAT_013222, partial [Characodon lateralis]|nr:hypothetical protein [Characodon lateralis]